MQVCIGQNMVPLNDTWNVCARLGCALKRALRSQKGAGNIGWFADFIFSFKAADVRDHA